MVRCAAVVVSLLGVLAGAWPAEAQSFGRNTVRYDRLDFRVLETEHFDIYYYAEEEAATRHAARMAERWYARFSRLLDHTFTRRQPLVMYASHPHFTQTNVSQTTPREGVGGLTERVKSRIAMPFAAGLGETDHVLGHEIAHAFQIDVAKRVKQDAFTLPSWFIEGMAEYLSLGSAGSHTMMWMRDAALHHDLPAIKDLGAAQFFPYRYGHALWSYLTARYGDEIIGRILRSKARRVVARLEEATGLDEEALTRDWHESILDTLDAAETPGPPSRTVAASGDARYHVAPAISPDGRLLMFVSERDQLSLDLFMADASTGTVIRKIVSTAADPHFDSLQYIHSAGAWDRTGTRFAMTALSGGNPVLVILDANGDGERLELPLYGVGEAYNPSWSPDGTRVVFSGLKGGLSDLFMYTLPTRSLVQLTADAFADLHPSWSPDGKTIAFATDRFTTRLNDLSFGPLRVGLLDPRSGLVRELMADDASEAKQVSPQWSPEGDAIYFVSDRSGVSNVYRTVLASGELRQVTNVPGGVSGITSTSPALAVASEAGTLAFSVYREGRYEIDTLDETAALAAPAVSTGDEANTATATDDDRTLTRMLSDARTGLPDVSKFEITTYDDRLRLESIAPPYIGAVTSGGFGGLIRASFGMSFADVLRDRQLQAAFRVGTDVDDLAAQLEYTNRKGQWSWGIAGGFVPSRFLGARRAIEREEETVTRETAHLRYTHQWVGLAAHFNVNRAQRFEFGAGLRRTGFRWQTITRVIDAVQRRTVSRSLDEAAAGKPVYVAEGSAAFVHDTAVSGPTSPVLGQRLRVEIEPAIGGLVFADVGVDARRYFMPVRPVTLAVRIQHTGRYGPGARDARFTPLVMGLQTLVRGYDLRTFAADKCGIEATTCSPLNELTGSRLALVNLELRAPLLGLLTGNLHYGKVPIEVIAFADAGFLWTRKPGSTLEQDRFRSVGAGGRANVGGFIFEVTAARPFDRRGAGWTTSLLLRPGF
jgi:Tol biopolymer transport system component